MKIHNGTLADIAIQCVHPETKSTGCWLFVAGNHREHGTSVSPLFDNLAPLYGWMRENGWKTIGRRAIYQKH